METHPFHKIVCPFTSIRRTLPYIGIVSIPNPGTPSSSAKPKNQFNLRCEAREHRVFSEMTRHLETSEKAWIQRLAITTAKAAILIFTAIITRQLGVDIKDRPSRLGKNPFKPFASARIRGYRREGE